MDPTTIQPPSGGVRRDQDPEDISDGELTDAENMLHRDGNFQTRPGFGPLLNNIGQRPMTLFHYEDAAGTPLVVLGTDRGWWVFASTSLIDLTDPVGPLTADEPHQAPIFRTFSKANINYLLGTNGKDPFKVWDGAALTYRNVAGDPPIARAMCVLADRIVLGNLVSGDTISPVAIDVSANKDFDSGWATQLVALLADTSGPIISMLEMGTLQGAIIKSDTLYMLIAQGGIDPFRIQWIKGEISGPPTAHLSFKLTDGRIGWAGYDGSVSLFDGAGVSQLPYHIQKEIASTFNPDEFDRGWADYDSERRELWIVYPLKGSTEPDGGVVINMTTLNVYPVRFATLRPSIGHKIPTQGGLTIGDLTMPIGQIDRTIGELGESSVVKRLVIGDIGGQLYDDTETTDGGEPIPVFWESPVRGKPEGFTSVMRCRHRFYPTPGPQIVNFQLGKRNEAGEIAYGALHSFDISSTRRKATGHRTSAEYFATKYSASATQAILYNGGAFYTKSRGRR